MKKVINYITKNKFYIILFPIILLGCEDFLELEQPLGQINSSEVFEDETTATAAVTTLYGLLRDEILLTGKPNGLSTIMGIYADEMDYYGLAGGPIDSFYQHQVFSDDQLVENTWNASYSLIFRGNAILEGLDGSQSLNSETKSQLRGEVLFIRSLTYFYLVNLFGDIPYPTTTNYEVNTTLSRIPIQDVYGYIVNDLNQAKLLLGNNYISGGRVRANKMVVSALLSRVYLYMEQWDLAESESSQLINNTSMFILEPDVSNEFLKESTSAILQFKPKNEGDNAQEAQLFLLKSGPPQFVSLNPQLYESMETNDQRRAIWIGEVTDGTEVWYYPNKYKIRDNTGTSLEYSIVFRLAEQFLIRAEARAMLGNFTEALEDLNKIRVRAGLPNSVASNQSEIMEAIIIERYHELFSEFGHRWFDLKRYGIASDVLAPIKPGWRSTDVLFPIPDAELLINPNLNPQNPGY